MLLIKILFTTPLRQSVKLLFYADLRFPLKVALSTTLSYVKLAKSRVYSNFTSLLRDLYAKVNFLFRAVVVPCGLSIPASMSISQLIPCAAFG